VGVPLSLQAQTFMPNGDKAYSGNYFWNFGDGSTKQVNIEYNNQPFTHTYAYAGDYIITLDYYQGCCSSDTPDTSNQVDVKIIPADISISAVGDANDFFVQLTNNTAYSADLSNWILGSATKSFTLPKDTILGSKNKIIISPNITGFSVVDANTLRLATPDGKTVFNYGATVSPDLPNVPIQQAVSTNTDQADRDTNQTTTRSPKTKDTITADTFPAVSQNSGTGDGQASDLSANSVNSKGDLTSKDILITAIFFIGVAAYAVYVIRRKKVIQEPNTSGADFDILDE
jgi:hypothetical protein